MLLYSAILDSTKHKFQKVLFCLFRNLIIIYQYAKYVLHNVQINFISSHCIWQTSNTQLPNTHVFFHICVVFSCIMYHNISFIINYNFDPIFVTSIYQLFRKGISCIMKNFSQIFGPYLFFKFHSTWPHFSISTL